MSARIVSVIPASKSAGFLSANRSRSKSRARPHTHRASPSIFGAALALLMIPVVVGLSGARSASSNCSTGTLATTNADDTSVASGVVATPSTTIVNHAGGFRRREGPRKGYIIKGKRYWLTDEELSIEIALMLAEVSRSDIKEVTAGKPKTISKRTWDAIRPLERMEALVPNYDEDDEEALLMLM